MKNLLYLVAGWLVISWGILFFGFKTNGSVNVLLVIAFFLLFLRFFNNKKLARSLEIHPNPHSSDKQGKAVTMADQGGIKVVQMHPKQ